VFVVLGQSKPIVMGCLSVIFGVLAVEMGVAAFGPVVAVPLVVARGQEFGEIVVVLAPFCGAISGIRGGVSLVGGIQDPFAGLHARGKSGLPSSHGGLASFEVRTLSG
jgi:hypothetical protein